MDVRFISPFLESIKHLFKTMLNTEVTLSKPLLRRDDLYADVSAVVGFSGDATGCVVLCFPISTAVKAASAFAGVELTKDHEDFPDALGELANIVAGQAKAQLEEFNIRISLPNVIFGTAHSVQQSKQRPRLTIPCGSSLGRFTVEVAMVVDKMQGAGRPGSATAGAGVISGVGSGADRLDHAQQGRTYSGVANP